MRAIPQGLEIEAGKRLALKVVDEASLVGGKGVDNRGGAVEAKGGPEVALSSEESTFYRRSVAIINSWRETEETYLMQVRNCRDAWPLPRAAICLP